MGQRSKTRVDQKGEENLFAKRTISNLLSFHGYPPALVQGRLQNRLYGTRHPQVQKQNEVTDVLQETGAQKLKKMRRRMAVEARMTVCEIVLNGWTSSQIIWEDTHNARVPSHVSQDSDSERATKAAERPKKHSIFTHFPKDRNCELWFFKLKLRNLLAEVAPAKQYFEQKSSVI